MNSPDRNYRNKSVRPTTFYNGDYDERPFIPSEYNDVEGYKCVSVLPNTGALFYRMDEQEPVFYKKNKNTYFGIQPTNIMGAYKAHSHLYVVKPTAPINLIDMGILENVEKLLSNTVSDDIKTSIHTAFPIVDSSVTRNSRPPEDHGGIDHDRRVLEYICGLPNIDGYYVDVEGLHAEIGFCQKSLDKLKVVDRFFVNPPRKELNSKNITHKRNRYSENYIPLSFENATSSSEKFPRINRKLKLENLENNSSRTLNFKSLGGSKRKQTKTHKKRRTHRK